ncbi:hypothetical protein CHS0354_040501 [Potamilus streckersoni]|uniref:Fibronectin type-III domain-containing protein n=1 Tax=Potamilus streckersoni TaxID=2493646 RepID=A0AAE0TK30_9BIVA|nr:hypothetical protein CHS0354_040501 [Potamilus streckersoni]
MTIEITNVQIVGTISAEVEWLSLNEAVIYQVDYSCRPDETVVLNDVTESRCRLTNLRWDSTYTVNVTMQLLNGSRVTFDKQRFKTDPEVKCFPLAIREICDDKVQVMDSLDEFIASTRIPNNISYIQKEEFHGIVFAPALREERQFWTMNIDLTIFEKWCDDETFLEFGIVDYSHIDDCSSLSIGHNTYSCSISKKTKKTFHIQFHDSSFRNDHSRELALKLYQKTHFSYGFLYDRLNSEFAIMDCQSRELLHVFFNVQFEEEHNVIFAICTFHTKLKMRLSTKLDYMHCNMENVSYWMRKINSFKTDHLDSTSPSLSD